MSKIRNRPEQAMQIELMKHIWARSMPGVVAYHIPNAAKMPVYIGALLKRAGLRAGMPDLGFVYRGQPFFLELKAGKSSKPSPVQVECINQLEIAGAKTAIAHSLDQAITTLEYWGILRRSQQFGISEAQSEEAA